jgi:acyl dehydratase
MDLSAARALIGHEIGLSDWITISQESVDAHAANTADDLWIHTDPERAARETPFEGSIAQSSLLLSHLTNLARAINLHVENVSYQLHYGFDRLRVVQPVPVGSRVRGRFELKGIEPKGHHGVIVHVDVSFEIEGDDIAPALVAEWLVYLRVGDG